MDNRTSFGLDAGAYRAFRPTYPDTLFSWLAAQCPHTQAALDCATGSGQAALGLTNHFERVVASDTDAAQIARAPSHERVEYVVAAAEALPDDLGVFDLVTVAQGAHWFDIEAFSRRLQPLLAPAGIVAIWGYSHCRIDAAVDALLDECLVGAVDAYWAQGNRVIMDRYRTLAFPWNELATPEFVMHVRWTRDAFFNFARTWSAHKRLIADGATDPLDELAKRLDDAQLWLPGQARDVQFDLHMRVGRANG